MKGVEDMAAVRVLLADDHPVVREGLSAMLESDPGIDVVGQAGSGEEAVTLTARLAPDVVLLDLRMGGMDGVAATGHILRQSPRSKVVIVTTYEDDSDILRAVEAGAAKLSPQGQFAGRADRCRARCGTRGDRADPVTGSQAVPGAGGGSAAAVRPGVRGAAAGQSGTDECRHRPGALHRRGHGQDPSAACVQETGGVGPDGGRDHGAGARVVVVAPLPEVTRPPRSPVPQPRPVRRRSALVPAVRVAYAAETDRGGVGEEGAGGLLDGEFAGGEDREQVGGRVGGLGGGGGRGGCGGRPEPVADAVGVGDEEGLAEVPGAAGAATGEGVPPCSLRARWWSSPARFIAAVAWSSSEV